MKKVSLLLLSLCTGLIMYAQSEPQLRTPMEIKTRFGVKGGVNLATYNVNQAPVGLNNYSTDMKTSFHGGVFVNVPLSTVFRVQPELIYSGQGSKLSFTPTGANTSINVEQDLHYLNLPIMLQAQTTNGFFVETGPQFGYLLRANNDGDAPYNGDIKDQLDKFDFSWGAGIGYITRIGLGIGAKYNFGLTNLIEDSENNNDNGPELKNKVIQIGLTYQFGAHK